MKYILVIDTVHGQKSCTNLMSLMKNIYPTTIIPFTGAFLGAQAQAQLLRWCHSALPKAQLFQVCFPCYLAFVAATGCGPTRVQSRLLFRKKRAWWDGMVFTTVIP